jgi:dCMP deaminase
MRSPDSATKQGCIAVGSSHEPLSMGYNAPPRGCIDDEIPLTRPEKYPFFIHAEENAINNAARKGIALDGSTFYITGHPCARCFRNLLQVGARRVVYGPVTSNKQCVSPEDLQAIQIMLKGRKDFSLEKFRGDSRKVKDIMQMAVDYFSLEDL